MANVWEFSPDAGTTKYDITDLQGRDDIDGINLLDYTASTQTASGITYTVNNDKTISTENTSNATSIFNIFVGALPHTNKPLILSGCPEGGGNFTTYQLDILDGGSAGTQKVYDEGNGATFSRSDFTNPDYVCIRIRVAANVDMSGKVFKPMITEAKYSGIPYRPFNQQSIQHQINDITGVTGVGNFFQVTAQTQTVNGVTFTINSDKIVTITGAATGYASINNIFPLKPNQYILNGLAGSVNMTYEITRLIKNGTTVSGFSTIEIITQGDYYLDLSGYDFDSIEIRIKRFTNGAVSGTIKPKLRLASDPDDTYVPFAMTNRELTESAVFKLGTLTSSDNLNNVTKTGFYSITTSPTNAPESAAYCGLIVIKNSNSDIKQMIIKEGTIYTRSYGGAQTPAWGGWRKYTGTVVS